MVLCRGDHPISIEPCMDSKEGLVIERSSSNGPPKRVWSYRGPVLMVLCRGDHSISIEPAMHALPCMCRL